jgi:hypothetical protein
MLLDEVIRMFKPGTIFIIGAGANEEVGMPLGSALCSAMARSFFFEFNFSSEPQKGADHNLLNHIRRLAKATDRKVNEYLNASRLFHDGILLAGSIDEYLSRHADKPLHSGLGKLAILHLLLSAERQSRLFHNEHANANVIVRAAKDSWLANFAHQLFIGRPAGDLDRMFDDITVISFNYDRCLQRYLIAAIQQAYHVSLERAQEVVARLEIIYPYGTLGSLLPASSDYLPFGADVAYSNITDRINNIRTFNEHFDDSEQKMKIHSLIAQANALVFLGFGFHNQNVDLLRPPKGGQSVVSIVATGFGLSQPNVQNIVKRLKGMLPSNVQEPIVERELKAARLLADYRMVLAA